MSDKALQWAIGQDVRSWVAREVLLTLAGQHQDGGFCLDTAALARLARHDRTAVAASLWELRNDGLIRCTGIGGVLSVELGCDYGDGEGSE